MGMYVPRIRGGGAAALSCDRTAHAIHTQHRINNDESMMMSSLFVVHGFFNFSLRKIETCAIAHGLLARKYGSPYTNYVTQWDGRDDQCRSEIDIERVIVGRWMPCRQCHSLQLWRHAYAES